MVDGAPGLGKTTAVKAFARDYELLLRRRFPERYTRPYLDYIPVVFFSMPSEATPKKIARVSRRVPQRSAQLPRRRPRTDDCRSGLHAGVRYPACGNRRYPLRAPDQRQRREREQLPRHLRLARGCNIRLRRCDVYESSFSNEEEPEPRHRTPQVRRGPHDRCGAKRSRSRKRTIRLVKVQPRSRCADRGLRVSLRPLQASARQPRPQPAPSGRTIERISSLSQLLRFAAIVAIEEGYERIDRRLLKTIRIDYKAQRHYENGVGELSREAA